MTPATDSKLPTPGPYDFDYSTTSLYPSELMDSHEQVSDAASLEQESGLNRTPITAGVIKPADRVQYKVGVLLPETFLRVLGSSQWKFPFVFQSENPSSTTALPQATTEFVYTTTSHYPPEAMTPPLKPLRTAFSPSPMPEGPDDFQYSTSTQYPSEESELLSGEFAFQVSEKRENKRDREK